MRASGVTALLLGACLASASPPKTDFAPGPSPALAARHEPHTTAVGIAPPMAVWVEVDADGQPVKTHTPSQTVIDGTTSLLDAPPYEITGTVFTEYHPDRTVYATRLPQPKSDGSGAFPLCTATAGADGSPFCWPREGDTLFVDTQYYIIWDPKLFDEKKIIYSITSTTTTSASTTTTTASSSTALAARATETTPPLEQQISEILHRTVRIRGERVNRTNQDDELLFISDEMRGTKGVYTLKISNKYMDFKHPTNLSLTLVTTLDGDSKEYAGPIVTMKYRPAHGHSSTATESREMYIVLPIICGLVVLMGIGMIVYNRNIRRIGFGNIMGRKRGRTGHSRPNRRKGGYKQVSGQDPDQDGIQLMDGYDDSSSDEDGYAGSSTTATAKGKAKGKRKFRSAMPSPFDDYPPHIRANMTTNMRDSGGSRSRYSTDPRQAKRD
ncbi:hypothetical protein CFIMG_000179RA [Ceratocystis fimbriata CBS 114723]|uniref:Uncharacterized protein n=1 Tax=Ceratocystis fimbriata CBS 114723 TaxID=1035309 RepID=A0A2C5WZ88_9PEZI|nr:hypothetical protein CFIMG_000179RA [Ceratocystis fimbriata CBS 114723]